MPQKRIALYARISQDDRKGSDLEGSGVDNQAAVCRAKAADMGFTVTHEPSDNDISGYTRKRRPGFEQLLALMTNREIDAVIVWHTDRLYRNGFELENYIQVSNANDIPTYAVVSGPLDLTTADGRMQARVVGAVNIHHSEHKSEQVKLARASNIAKGKRLGGGARPFGFTRTPQHKRPAIYTLNEPEAELVEKAIHDLLPDPPRRTLYGIVKEWNAAGHRTVGGLRWNTVLLRSCLMRPSNGGLQYWTDADGIEHESEIDGPRIVEPDVMRAFLRRMTDPKRRSSPTWEPRHLLSGIARCDKCASPMRAASTAKNSGKHFKVLRCTGVGCWTTISEPVADAVVIDRLVRWYAWAQPESMRVASGVESQIVAIRTRLDAIDDEQTELLRLRKSFPIEHIEAEAATLNAERDKLKATLGALLMADAELALVELAQQALIIEGSSVRESPEHRAKLREAFDAMSLNDQRTIIRNKFSVVIKTGGRGSERVAAHPHTEAAIADVIHLTSGLADAIVASVDFTRL